MKKWILEQWHSTWCSYHTDMANIIYMNSCGFEEIAATNPKYLHHSNRALYHKINKRKD